MNDPDLIDDFKEIRNCIYKNEKYSVRDNGAILRHMRVGKRKRKDDGVWTFGIKDNNTGYMHLGSHRIHIIVATAFYGENDTKKYIVDHIDTNRSNNRKENLRWLTRLENVLMNPVTLKKIEYLCDGDITKFLKDPSCLQNSANKNQDVAWMRTVSSEEAKNAYTNVMQWVSKKQAFTNNSQSIENKDNKATNSEKSWMFEKPNDRYQIDELFTRFKKATYPEHALQMNWRTPTKFPCCPLSFGEDPLIDYLNALDKNVVFSENRYGKHIVVNAAIIEDNEAIIVWTQNMDREAIKPYALAKIYFSGGQYLHKSEGSFFEEFGAEKYFILAQGKTWTGGDVFDDNC